MATKPLLDFDALLTPIPGDNPAGPSLRYAGDYDEIKALLPKPDRDIFEASGQEGQWPKLVQLTSQKIKQKSKDLAIAAWLTEGLVHQHGFAGLRDGLLLIHGLCDQFWDYVYPLPDEGDWEVRAAPLQSLLERNAPIWIGEAPLTKAPIIVPETEEKIPVSINLRHAISTLDDKKPLQGPMESAVDNSPTDWLQTLYADIEGAEAALMSLRDLVDEKLGDASPSTVSPREVLAKCKNYVASVLLKRGVRVGDAADDSETSDGDNEDGTGAHGSNGARTGPIGNREDALERLREVADFFRRTEPHSPVPYLIQRAINWSRMSFEQLLLELVKDDNARLQINSTLGLDGGGGGDSAWASPPSEESV
jgi:type VI secretion system protein ImpA